MEGTLGSWPRRNDKTVTTASGFLMANPMLFPPPPRPSDFFSLITRCFHQPGLRLCFVASLKRLPAVRETQVQSLGWEDPLEKEMATHSSTLAWKIPWTEEPGRLQSHGVTKSQTRLSEFTFLSGEQQYVHMTSRWRSKPCSQLSQ